MIFCSIFNPAPTFTDVTISNLSASQAVMTDANKKLVSADYLNQAVKDTSSPTFKIITITDLSAGGLVLSTAGLLSVITNNSANWNTAYGWGNHAGLYLPLAGTAADSDKLDGQHGSYYQVAGSYQPLATNLTSLAGLTFVSTSFVKMTSAGTFGLDTNVYYKSGDSPTFANITDSGLTITRIPYASTAGLLIDSANLTFDGSYLKVIPSTSAGIFFDGTLDYYFRVDSQNFLCTYGPATSVVRLYKGETVNTNANVFAIRGMGDITSNTNFEQFFMAWLGSATGYNALASTAAGSGTARPIHIYCGTNTNQLVLNTDGSINISGTMYGSISASGAVEDGTYTVGNRITPVTGNLGQIIVEGGIITGIQEAT